jgi:hypothetical protein
MRKRVLPTLAVLCAAAIATAAIEIDPDARYTLSTIDQIPTKQQITTAFGGSDQHALDELVAIAGAPDTTVDPLQGVDAGIKLRAIHALAKYCVASPCAAADPAHAAVAQVVGATRTATSGSQVLFLRAAVETLGAMRVSTDAPTLWPLLDHPSRDIRAATARALRDLCNNQAIPPLRARYSAEMTDQVKLAISEALRILGQCSNL